MFCGHAGKLTGEHVFGDWLARIGLDMTPVRFGAGPINQTARDLGTSLPFARTVRNVCAPCNNGWMSNLETIAARVLTPMVLGNSGSVSRDDAGALAAWIQKTALVGMLVSSAKERANGYGVPEEEYRQLYAERENVAPLPKSRFWIGRYQGPRSSTIWVTPMIVNVDGLAATDSPQAYVMTIVLGQVLLHGVRFTVPSVQLDLRVDGLHQVWPKAEDVTVLGDDCIDDPRFARLSKGLELISLLDNVSLSPWRPAADLPHSEEHGSLVRLPTPCQHFMHYPRALAIAGMHGNYCIFVISCECGKTYLVQTESDGTHFKAEGSFGAISAAYNELPGEEVTLQHDSGEFVFKLMKH